MGGERLTLRSYRLAFDLERRLHRIDRFRIPVPYGVPLAGIGYGAAAALVVVVASGLPVIGQLLALAPWPMRLILVPAVTAHVLCRTRDDGRPVHEAVVARLAGLARSSRLAALQPSPRTSRTRLGDITIAPDESGPAYRRGHVLGPVDVLFRQPASGCVRGSTIEIRQLADRPMLAARELRLGEGQRVRFR